MTTTSDVLESVRISEVYQALGGPKIRAMRGTAFWRGGDGYNVSLNDQKNAWKDFPTDEGGGVLDLIQRVQGGSRREAFRWLAAVFGLPTSDLSPAERADYARQRQQDERDRSDAQAFADAAVILAEQMLENLEPWDLQRWPLTRLVMALRTDTGVLAEFRAWRGRDPRMTRALVAAGANHVHRLRGSLEFYLLREGDTRAA